MLSQQIIKHEFVTQTLQWGLQKLRQAQLDQLRLMQPTIVDRHFDWESLYQGVAQRQQGVVGSGGHYRVIIPVDKHLRFADMKRFASGRKAPNAAVYNRPTWGVMSGRDDSVRTRLKEGIGNELADHMYQQLQQAFNSVQP